MVKQFNAGNKPRQILTYLEDNFKGDLVITRDIYNCITQLRRQRKGNKSFIETLLSELENKGWICRLVYKVEDGSPDRLLSVFFAHPRLLEYARIYSKVIILDHTYNTNSGEMPLFKAIGIDATRKSFCICFEFTAGEDIEDCIQSLELLKEMLGEEVPAGVFLVDKAEAIRLALETVFPDQTYLLCLWHANKNVSQKCKSHFTEEEQKQFIADWIRIVYSSTVENYEEAIRDFKTDWLDSYLEDVAYIEANWLVPRNRDRIVSFWTDNHLHLGNTVTSRAEGIYGTIKADIHLKNIDLLYAWDVIDDVVLRQLKAVDAEQRRQRHATKKHYEFAIFNAVRGRVSFTTLDLAYNQLKMAKVIDKDNECSGRFSKSIGIPCKHKIYKKLEDNQLLELVDFDSLYYLRRFVGEDYQPPTLPPIRRPGRQRRHNGSQTSTRRLESGFEREAREAAQKIVYKNGKRCMQCSICPPEQKQGHKKNMIICPSHPRHADWVTSQGNNSVPS